MRRTSKIRKDRSHDPQGSGPPCEAPSPPSVATQEIGHNSWYALGHELQDTTIVELYSRYIVPEVGGEPGESQPALFLESRVTENEMIEAPEVEDLAPSDQLRKAPKIGPASNSYPLSSLAEIHGTSLAPAPGGDCPLASPVDLMKEPGSRSSSAQSTYANIFDFGFYHSRHGTPANDDPSRQS